TAPGGWFLGPGLALVVVAGAVALVLALRRRHAPARAYAALAVAAAGYALALSWLSAQHLERTHLPEYGIAAWLAWRAVAPLLRYTLIAATAYLILVEGEFSTPPLGVVLAITAALLSNVLASLVPARMASSSGFGLAVIVADTAWITAALVASGRFNAEFFYLYLFVLLPAAIGANLPLIAVGSVVVCCAYLYALSVTASCSPGRRVGRASGSRTGWTRRCRARCVAIPAACVRWSSTWSATRSSSRRTARSRCGSGSWTRRRRR